MCGEIERLQEYDWKVLELEEKMGWEEFVNEWLSDLNVAVQSHFTLLTGSASQPPHRWIVEHFQAMQNGETWLRRCEFQKKFQLLLLEMDIEATKIFQMYECESLRVNEEIRWQKIWMSGYMICTWLSSQTLAFW